MEIDISDPQYAAKMKILQALYHVKDPELDINIIDLGLVYSIGVNDESKVINIQMTLSTPSCPLGGMITNHARFAIEDVFPGYTVNVELTWTPLWNYDMITTEGKAALGL
jgi:metal-sulfur cluster biosynthetic enzyme